MAKLSKIAHLPPKKRQGMARLPFLAWPEQAKRAEGCRKAAREMEPAFILRYMWGQPPPAVHRAKPGAFGVAVACGTDTPVRRV